MNRSSHRYEYKHTTQPSISTDDDSTSQLSNPVECSFCSCISRLLWYIAFGVLVLAGIAIGIVVWTGASQPSEFFVQEDPPGRNETLLWPTAMDGINDGLQLVVENALMDTWTPYLEYWVERWDAGYGTVDPLSLSIERVTIDPDCTPSQGRIKVCNGDYGRTDWRGINVALIQGEFMIHSVAKLNDYWLYEEDQKQYTMCHELGHGFGLAHTDEIYTNINTGECMDYTNRPGRNLNPGDYNFDLLASIYGVTTSIANTEISNTHFNPTTTNTITPEWSGQSPSNNENMWNNYDDNENNNENNEYNEEENDNRWLRQRRAMAQIPANISDSIMEEYYKAIQQMEQMTCMNCLVDLSEGYRIEMHRLFAF